MRKIIITSFLISCIFSSYFAQPDIKQIKQIIYDDLLTLNGIYKGSIIQFNQYLMITKYNDTIIEKHTLMTLKDSSDSRVEIIKIDNKLSYYFVEVKFNLLPMNPYSYLFSENTFKYVLYKELDEFYKINGFLISEILLPQGLKWYKGKAKINVSHHRFNRYLKKRNVAKIQKYLSVSVLKEIGGFRSDKPYVKDLF